LSTSVYARSTLSPSAISIGTVAVSVAPLSLSVPSYASTDPVAPVVTSSKVTSPSSVFAWLKVVPAGSARVTVPVPAVSAPVAEAVKATL
jgi:hypothetical protein